ncbi:MAG: hypothetical protein ACLU0O_00645 [Collinsella sp.]
MTSGKDIVVNRAKLGREGCKDVIAAAYRYKVASSKATDQKPPQRGQCIFGGF